MSNSSQLALGQRIDALNQKIESVQREISDLRRDMKKILWLVEHGRLASVENEDSAVR